MRGNQAGSAVLRVALDFALGVVVFALVVSCVTLGHGSAMASTGADGTVASPQFLTLFSNFGAARVVGWPPLTREVAILLLGLGAGAITALNLAIARHLTAVVRISARRKL